VPGVEVASHEAVGWGGEVRDIFEDVQVEGLAAGVEDRVAVYVSLKHFAAVRRAALLSLKAGPFADVCHNSGSFCLPLFRLSAVLAVNWRVAVVSWVILGLCARGGRRFLDADDVYLFCEG
jgi:hypothetical protein